MLLVLLCAVRCLTIAPVELYTNGIQIEARFFASPGYSLAVPTFYIEKGLQITHTKEHTRTF